MSLFCLFYLTHLKVWLVLLHLANSRKSFNKSILVPHVLLVSLNVSIMCVCLYELKYIPFLFVSNRTTVKEALTCGPFSGQSNN